MEQAYISLQCDELGYLYEGDTIQVTYKAGPLLIALLLALVAVDITASLASAKAAAAAASPDAPTEVAISMSAYATYTGVTLALLALLFIEFDMGEKVENSGETWPNKAKFRIKYGNEGEGSYFTDVYIFGIATSAYRKDIKIYLPPNPDQKDRTIKVYKVSREKNIVKEGEAAARYKDKLTLGAVTEVTPINLSYPNSVVIGTRVNARDYPQVPTRTYNLKLKKVSVPSNYNTETREYIGSWSGLFKGQSSLNDRVPEVAKEWTDNPAWCLYDLISNKRFGAGRFGINPDNVDRWTLYKIAKYCDQLVLSGYSPKYKKRNFGVENAQEHSIKIEVEGTYTAKNFQSEFGHIGKKLAIFYSDGSYDLRTINSAANNIITLDTSPSQISGECAAQIDYPLLEPRYTLNAYLTNSQNAFKLINEFAAIFRTFAYWAGNAIHFFQDEKKEALMLFANNNVSEEGFSYSSTPRTSRTNSCKIKYVDKYNQFRPKMEYAEDRASINKNTLVEQSADGFGITSKAQAQRAAEFIVQGANLETELISFKTSVIGSYLRPGDVVDVLDNKRTVGRFAGKVLDISISGDGKMAELDVDFPVRTIVDEDDKTTYKKITLYKTSGNQTIESLDAITERGGTVSDAQIDNMRVTQVGQYLVTKVSDNDTKIKLSNNPYSFVSGEYSWVEALRDARDQDGILATINNETDQAQVQAVLPTSQKAWIGGYNQERPSPEKFVWHQPQACSGDEITYFSWAEGFPKVGDPIETDLAEPLITDVDLWKIITDSEEGYGNYIAVSGSPDTAIHGDWVTLSGSTGIGYILEKKADNSLLELNGVEGTTFMIEDDVNFANKKQYTILNIIEEEKGVFTLQGKQYNSGKFGYIEDNISLPPPTSPIIFTEKSLGAPSSVSIETLGDDYSSNIPMGLRARWNTVSGAASYRVQFFNENTLLATFTKARVAGLESDTLEFRSEKVVEGATYYSRVYAQER